MDKGLRFDNRTPLVAMASIGICSPILVEDSIVFLMLISVARRIPAGEEMPLGLSAAIEEK
jgi:hypothetical protein